MIGKNIVAGSFDSMAAAFKSSNFSKPSSVSGDFSKTMSSVQDNQAKSVKNERANENKKSNTDFAKGMKKLTDSDKPAVDGDKRLEAKKNTKSLKETQDAESENAIVLARSKTFLLNGKVVSSILTVPIIYKFSGKFSFSDSDNALLE